MKVIDVGAAPGGWSQIIAERVDSQPSKESVIAVDLHEMLPISGVKFVQGNIDKDEIQEKVSEMLDFTKADLVCSDAVPDFVGERFVDHMQSVELNYIVMSFCRKNLRKGGSLLMKIMQGQGYEQSKEKLAIERKAEVDKINSLNSESEVNNYMKDLTNEGKQILQEMVNEMHKRGQDLPDDLREKFKSFSDTKDINLESKMNLREKQKAKKIYEDEEDRLFTEQTGIKDESKEANLDFIMKKYEKDMKKYEKKLEKMEALDKQGIDYDIDEIEVTEDEDDQQQRDGNQESQTAQAPQDEPYKAAEDEYRHKGQEFERIKNRIEELEKEINGEKTDTPEQEYIKKYEQILDDVDGYQNNFWREEQQEMFEQEQHDDRREMERLDQEDRKVRDSFYSKKSQKQTLKKTGGVKSESPIWDDE